jgi:hypothetical protein
MVTRSAVRGWCLLRAAFVALFCTAAHLCRADEEPNSPNDIASIVDYAKRLADTEKWPHDKLCRYLDKLDKQGNLIALEAICRADISGYAGILCVRHSNSEKAIALCTTLPGIYGRDAVCGLEEHPRKAVIGYLKQIAQSSDPDLRELCYHLCRRMGWPDLQVEAEQDRHNQDCLLFGRICQTISDGATEYLESLNSKARARLQGGPAVPALEAIHEAGLPLTRYAITVAARKLDDEKVVAYCTTFPLGSEDWRAAFAGLDAHPKKAVIGYILLMADSYYTEVRAQCYDLCRRLNWDDLKEAAAIDAGRDPERAELLAHAAMGARLREAASAYLARVDPKGTVPLKEPGCIFDRKTGMLKCVYWNKEQKQ